MQNCFNFVHKILSNRFVYVFDVELLRESKQVLMQATTLNLSTNCENSVNVSSDTLIILMSPSVYSVYFKILSSFLTDIRKKN